MKKLSEIKGTGQKDEGSTRRRCQVAAGEEESVPCFKTSEDSLTFLLGANETGDLKLNLMLIYHF